MPYKLLLADDSVTIQRVIELTFADEDVRVVAVSDGDQAIARLQSDPPDIVLADVGMPGKDGYEVAAFVKRSPALSNIPVVLLTGAFEPIDQARADSVGCDAVLAKPFEPQLVIGRVRELLAKRKTPAAAAVGASPAPAVVAASPVSATATPTAPAATQAPPAAAAPGARPRADVGKLDNYFDQLDAAISKTSKMRIPDSIDRFAPEKPSGAMPDLPLSHAPAKAPAAAAAAAPAPPKPATAAMPAQAPAPAPAAVPPAAPAPSKSTDELVEEVAKRVLERLSDRAMREKIAELFPQVAERLVREEIERVKSSIK